MIDTSQMHPQFAQWFAGLPAAAQLDLHGYFDGSASDPNIPTSAVGLYARLRATMDYAQTQYGYRANASTTPSAIGAQPGAPSVTPTIAEPPVLPSQVPAAGQAGAAHAHGSVI